MVPKRIVRKLVVAALGLPILMIVVAAFGKLLRVLGDDAGGLFFTRLAIFAGALWIVALIGLVVLPAIGALNDTDDEK